MSGFHVRRDKAALFQWVQGPPGDSLQPEATGAGMEVTKCLKPSDSGHQGDCASVQAATRVNAEQTSHGVVQVKSVCQGDVGKSPVFAPVSEVRAQLHDAARFRARSTSHSVAGATEMQRRKQGS